MVKIICDHCKKEISGNIVRIFANFVDDENEDIIDDLDSKQKERDYHMECAKKILSFANGVVEKEETNDTKKGTVIMNGKEYKKLTNAKELGEDNPKVEKSRKTKLDIGKIIALKNAGWSYEQIADEMHTTKASISSTLYNYKKKKEKEGERVEK